MIRKTLPESMVGWGGWLQDVAQMTEKISYNDIPKQVSEETFKKLKSLRSSWNRECSFDDSDDKLMTIGQKVSDLLVKDRG